MRGNHRKVTVKLIKSEHINNHRLIECLTNKYREGKIENEA